MKQSELDQKIEETVEAKAEAKLNALLEEAKRGLDEEAKEILQDGVNQVLADLAPDPEIKKAEEKADQFKSGGEFLSAVRKARAQRVVDNRLTYLNSKGEVQQQIPEAQEKTAGHLEIGEDAQGGFLVPEIYRNELKMIALENSIVRPRATVLPMTTDSLKIPYVDDTSHASTVFGGVSWTWTAEAAAKTPTKPTFGQMELTPHKLAGITYASDELLADSAIALAPLIKRMFGSAWGYGEDDAFLVGTGAGQPLGIQNCNAVINVFRNTANRVMIEDLAEMYSRLLPTSHSNAFWVINPTVIPELIELGSGNAADASGKNLVWIDRVNDALVWRIFGRPVLITEKMQALGTTGDIGYYDFRYYLIGDRQPITIDVSSHVNFIYDETCWRFVLRVAGQCWPQAAKTLRRGGITQSPFVQLNANTS
jgi:HK97 family phage major capsid protein